MVVILPMYNHDQKYTINFYEYCDKIIHTAKISVTATYVHLTVCSSVIVDYRAYLFSFLLKITHNSTLKFGTPCSERPV
jgi:hypothetical protein